MRASWSPQQQASRSLSKVKRPPGRTAEGTQLKYAEVLVLGSADLASWASALSRPSMSSRPSFWEVWSANSRRMRPSNREQASDKQSAKEEKEAHLDHLIKGSRLDSTVAGHLHRTHMPYGVGEAAIRRGPLDYRRIGQRHGYLWGRCQRSPARPCTALPPE
mgnify:FL=1